MTFLDSNLSTTRNKLIHQLIPHFSLSFSRKKNERKVIRDSRRAMLFDEKTPLIKWGFI